MTRNRDRRRNGQDAPDPAALLLAGDLDALRDSTACDLPPLGYAIGARGPHPEALPGGKLMTTLRNSGRRPWLVTALSAAVVAAVLLFIPISYDRLIGSELTLYLGGTDLSPDAVRQIAGELKAKLGAEKIRVEKSSDSGLRMIADISNASWRGVDRAALEYARGLAGRGIHAAPQVRPRFEKAQGNVYAAFGSLVEIRIETGGKSDAEIADEIRSRLLEAGLTDAQVEFSRQDGQTQIRVEAQKTLDGEAVPEGEEPPEFRVIVDGHTPEEPNVHEERVQVRVKRTDDMTDQQVIDEVKRQLEEQGVHDAEVTIENGKIKITRPPR